MIGSDDVYDMLDAFGAALDTAVRATVASGTELLLTKTNGGLTIAWISGRVPAAGFTLTSTFLSAWFRESNMNANCGGRYRVYKYTPGTPPTLTELGGGPFDDAVEFGTASAEMTWIGNVTDTALAEDDRIVVKLFLTNVGTMGGGFTCTLDFNAASATTGDSFFQIAETVTFKAEPSPITGDLNKSLPLALAAAGAVAVQGSFSKALPLALSAGGAVFVQGTLTKVLPLTLTATGTVGNPAITGALSKALPLTLSASGTLPVAAVLSRNLPLTVAASGAVEIRAAMTRTVSLSLAAAGAVEIRGALAKALPLTLIATGGGQSGSSGSGWHCTGISTGAKV